MYWIHCNSCLVQPGGQDAPALVITSCGHIFCVQCKERASPDKCPVCQNAFTTMELNSEMKPEMKDFFGNPMELMQRALSIANFQTSHTTRFVNKLRSYKMKYTAVKTEHLKLSEENIRLRKKLKSMDMVEGWYKSQLTSMKRKLAQMCKVHQRMTSSRFDVDTSPAPSVTMTPSSDYGTPQIPTVTNANQYRSQTNFTPFMTPAPSTGFSHGSFTGSSNMSTGDQRYQIPGVRSMRMQTPSEFASPSILSSLNFPSSQFRRHNK